MTLTANSINAKSTKYTFTLKDSAGKAVNEKTVSMHSTAKSTAQSVPEWCCKFRITYRKLRKICRNIGIYGDSTCKGSIAVSTIKIVEQATKLTVAKTLKKSAAKFAGDCPYTAKSAESKIIVK